jgi:hypothetical protein
MKKCYAMIHVWLHDMDHNIDINYRRKIRPLCMTQTDRENPQFRCYNRSSSLKYGKTNSALGFSKYLCPSLNTQSCIRGLLVVRDFYYWAIWAARPVLKRKVSGSTMSNFWGLFFQFLGAKKWQIFYKNTVASALKTCIKWSFKKRKKKS